MLRLCDRSISGNPWRYRAETAHQSVCGPERSSYETRLKYEHEDLRDRVSNIGRSTHRVGIDEFIAHSTCVCVCSTYTGTFSRSLRVHTLIQKGREEEEDDAQKSEFILDPPYVILQEWRKRERMFSCLLLLLRACVRACARMNPADFNRSARYPPQSLV